MISAIVIILLILLFIILGVHRGAARTLLNFAAMIAATAISHFLSSVIAQAVYDAFFHKTVLESLQTTIAQNGEEFAAKTSLQALPDGFERMLEGLSKLFGVSPEAIQGRLMLAPSQTDGIAQTYVIEHDMGLIAQAIEKPVSELCVFLLSVIVSIVIFALLWIIFKMIIRLVMPLFSLPGVHAVNKIFGGVLGALEGAVLAVFLCNILYVLISCTNPALTENATLFGSLFHALVFFK